MDSILRIYMPVSAKRKGPCTFWQRLFSDSLANYLLKQAKVFGIQQSVYQRVMAGYLKGKKLAFDVGEVVPDYLPQIVELIDREENLKSFVNKYKDQLSDCKAVLFQGATLLDLGTK